MIEFALEHGWKVNSPHDVNQRGGSVMIYVDDGPGMVQRLNERGVFVDCRPASACACRRISSTTDDEVNDAMETLAELI
jgi:kynureninase